MARILILSSWVATGHVGLSAAAPVLQRLGHEVLQLPTVMLSNHPGWPHVAGQQVPVAQIEAMAGAMTANGWLTGLDAVLTGYMPSAEHVTFVAGLASELRRSGARLVVDPVLGDLPKGLYVPEAVALALRETLLPLADTLTPNRFELGWLTRHSTETLPDAAAAARGLAPEVFVTSVQSSPSRTGVLSVTAGTRQLWSAPLREGVPNGVGDVFSALIAAGLPPGTALGHLDALIRESLAAPHLRIAESADDWSRAAPLPPVPLPET